MNISDILILIQSMMPKIRLNNYISPKYIYSMKSHASNYKFQIINNHNVITKCTLSVLKCSCSLAVIFINVLVVQTDR